MSNERGDKPEHQPMPFWQWKAEQIEKDKFTRPREWYFRAYGGYCNAVRQHGK